MAERVWGADWLIQPTNVSYRTLRSWGVRFVGRYTGTLTAAEARAIAAADLGLLVFFEQEPTDPLAGYVVGHARALQALSWAQGFGWRGPIVFACDTEVHDARPTLPFYRATSDVLGSRARAYGDTDLLNGLADLGLPTVASGVGSSAWSYGRRSIHEHVHQYFDDRPTESPDFEAHGMHYGANYDLEELVVLHSDLIVWPHDPPYTPGDDMPKLVRFVQEIGDTRIYLEVDGALTWMSGPDAWGDYARAEEIAQTQVHVHPGYLSGRPGKLSTVPPTTRLQARTAGLPDHEVTKFPDTLGSAIATHTAD